LLKIYGNKYTTLENCVAHAAPSRRDAPPPPPTKVYRRAAVRQYEVGAEL